MFQSYVNIPEGMIYWLVVWNMLFFSWEEQSQLTYICSEGLKHVETTNKYRILYI